MKLWIARDKDKELYIFTEKPQLHNNELRWYPTEESLCSELDKRMFPEITFENSPQEIKIRL